MDNKNAIVQLAFSMENAIPNGTTIINLQELYGFANMLPQTQFSWLYPTDEEFDKAWKEYTTIYNFMQDNFSICQICLPPKCRQIQSKDYLIKLLIPGNEQNRIVRICDKCGEHVDPYLNIYPQKSSPLQERLQQVNLLCLPPSTSICMICISLDSFRLHLIGILRIMKFIRKQEKN